MAKTPSTFGIKVAAQLLSLSEHRVRTMSKNGQLPCSRDSENRRVFQREDVLNLKKKRAAASDSEG